MHLASSVSALSCYTVFVNTWLKSAKKNFFLFKLYQTVMMKKQDAPWQRNEPTLKQNGTKRVNLLSLPPQNEIGAEIKFNHPNPDFTSKYAGKQLFYQIRKITEIHGKSRKITEMKLARKWEDPC